MQACPQSRQLQKHILASEVLHRTGQLRLAAMGQSMLPTIWPGDVLSVRTIGFEQVEAGDVVLFTRDGRFFIHRVVGKLGVSGGSTGPSLVTRGDSMRDADAPVAPVELLGRIEFVSRTSAAEFRLPQLSGWSRTMGRILAYSDLLRRLALRLHAWRNRDPVVGTEAGARELPLR